MRFFNRSEWTSGVKASEVVAHPVTVKGVAVKTVVLHHSVTGRAPALAKARAIEQYHVGPETDFFDLAYNFLVSASDSSVFEGRGSLVQGGATGAGMDAKSLSVCAIGNFEDSQVPEVLLNNLVDLLSKLVADGFVAADFVLRPHSDFKATACCGVNLVREIPGVVERVRHLGRPAGVGTAPVAEPVAKTAYSDAQKLAWITQILEM